MKGKAKKLFVHGLFIFKLGQLLTPCVNVMRMPLPQAISFIEKNVRLTSKKSSQKIASIAVSKIDKVKLIKNGQIGQFNNFAIQIKNNSLTMDEAILQIRGGDGISDIVVVLAFVIFVNWYDFFFGVEGFQSNPLPHHDPIGLWQGK